MTFTPYGGERYLDFDQLTAWCREAAESLPDWVSLDAVGQSRFGRPIWALTLGAAGEGRGERPGFWLDGGTHASEFTGVMAALFCASRWIAALLDADPAALAWFSRHTVTILPCLSPDGFDALCKGAPFMRSTLRPPLEGAVRIGLDPQDLDGDGAVRWMRWRHPAGPCVPDADEPLFMRPRRIDDDPSEAFFVAQEGLFLSWDGARWTQASLKHGMDLNRNFPGSWAPFSMFGMDGGLFPLSEPESRAAVDAFAARPHLAAAITNHTYTGCLLTQPYRAETPLERPDIDLMEALARDAVEGTGYDVFKVHPDFNYDPKRPTVGVWADTLATIFGVPGYTLELWNPMKYAGIEVKNPIDAFMRPEPEATQALIARFAQDPTLRRPWTPFEHPQRGPVELGGLEYLRTVRNPPEPLLAEECRRGFTIIDRVRRALPRVTAAATVEALAPDLWRRELILENHGFLPTSGLAHGARIGASPAVSATLIPGEVQIVEGTAAQALQHLEGWGQSRVGATRNVIYPGLPALGHRARATWLLRGHGPVEIAWIAGRAGRGRLSVHP